MVITRQAALKTATETDRQAACHLADDAAAVGHLDTVDLFDQGGFARAVAAKQGHPLPLVDGEVDALQHFVPTMPRAVAFANILADDHSTTHSTDEHTSELQSLMRISYAVFGSKKNSLLIYF